MSDSTSSLRRKIETASDLQSVVRTMKAVAASSITQYERAVESLEDYYRTVQLGLTVCLQHSTSPAVAASRQGTGPVAALVFGSDQGLVGQFNEVVADFALATLSTIAGKKTILSVGERVRAALSAQPNSAGRNFVLPGSISAITDLVAQVLIEIEALMGKGVIAQVYIFHNSPHAGEIYAPICQRLLPLDDAWTREQSGRRWPSGNLPQTVGAVDATLGSFVKEYLFVSIFRACTQSLASENASRLAAMQRAEKNIDGLMDSLNRSFHQLRQSDIDEELFDVISGFEALSRA